MPDRPFLTARWTNLCVITHALDPGVLAAHLPPGMVHDELPDMPGKALVSLVAFDFLETRVRGLRIPGHIDFPEVNLRIYVRDPETGDRGVSFVRELVPRHAISWVARLVYNEPYAVARMRSSVTGLADRVRVEHRFRFRGTHARILVEASPRKHASAEGSPERLLTQRLWGYGVTRLGRRLRYRVDHPVWELHEQVAASVELDYRKVYGAEWGCLAESAPVSVILAAGSEVSVSPCEA